MEVGPGHATARAALAPRLVGGQSGKVSNSGITDCRHIQGSRAVVHITTQSYSEHSRLNLAWSLLASMLTNC